MGKWKGSDSWMDDYDKDKGWKTAKDASDISLPEFDRTLKYTGSVARCYESHAEIEIFNGKIVGRNCFHPKKGYDIYIGLDHGMEYQKVGYPWEPKDNGIVEFCYNIVDRAAPKDVPNFLKMIDYLCENLEAGKNIHVGCFGGHGRTGVVLSALVKQALQIGDAISWVREAHCKKAVETKEQVEFLHKHYKIKKVAGSKEHFGTAKSNRRFTSTATGRSKSKGHVAQMMPPEKKKPHDPAKSRTFEHVKTKAGIW